MKKKISEDIEIPAGITCEVNDDMITCKKDGAKSERRISGKINAKIEGRKIILHCDKANRRDFAVLKSLEAHIKNMFHGLNEKYVYELEICNVHFPMTVKIEGSKLAVANFLGEKEKRYANISPGTNVEIRGQRIIVSGHDKEVTGQTAANIEKATWISKRDRRIFQDGIFLISKAGRPI